MLRRRKKQLPTQHLPRSDHFHSNLANNLDQSSSSDDFLESWVHQLMPANIRLSSSNGREAWIVLE